MSRLLPGAGPRPWDSPDKMTVPLPGGGKDWPEPLSKLLGEGPLSPWARQRLRSLSTSSKDTLFWSDLSQLAQEASQRGEIQFAANLFTILTEHHPHDPKRQTAQGHLSTLQGNFASTTDQLEHLSQNWISGATDPSLLVGMTAAGLAYRGARALSMKKLIDLRTLEAFGGRGLRSFSGLGGFFAEVPAFVLSSKVTASALGRQVSWDASSLQGELLDGALILGALKLSNLAGYGMVKSLHGVHPLKGPTRLKVGFPLSQRWVPQASTLGGLMVGHQLEAQLHGRKAPDLSHNLMQSLATLLQFQAGSHLARGMAPRLDALNQDWKNFSEQIVSSQASSWLGSGQRWSPSPQWAWATAGTPAGEGRSPLSHHVFMVANGGESRGQPKGDRLERAQRAANLAAQAQAAKLPYEQALSAIKEVLGEWISESVPKDFGEPHLNLLTKILVGKSLTPRALALRFGGDGLATTAKPYIMGDKLGFNIRIETGREVLAHFDVDLLFKQVYLSGEWRTGWVAHRGRMFLNENYKWRGYWTLLTLQLADWARTGNFIAIESEASTDGGKASMADIFDVAAPTDFQRMHQDFSRHVEYEGNPLDPATLRKIPQMAHPWEIMEVKDIHGNGVGYDFLKNYREPWQGVLPVQGLSSLQWTRLLRRAFMEKKLWKLDSRFPVPANTRIGKIEGDEDLHHYAIDHATQRYLSSLQRMEDHLAEFHAPPQSTFAATWNQYRAKRIRPMVEMVTQFRESLRQIPRELEQGEIDTQGALRLLVGAQADLQEFKVSLRNLTAHLHLDYLAQHRIGVGEKMLEEALEVWDPATLAPFQRDLLELDNWYGQRIRESHTLLEKIEFLQELDPRAQEILWRHSQDLGKRTLREKWEESEPPAAMAERFGEFVFEAYWRQLNGSPELMTALLDMATTLQTVYGHRPWDFYGANSLKAHDLLWGMGPLKSMDQSELHNVKSSAEIIEQSTQNIRGLRDLLPEHLPLLLVKGSHFKAPLLTPLGQETQLNLVVSPSRGAHEGGLAFSLYPNNQVPYLHRGKSRPLYQVVLRLNARSRLAEIRVPQSGRHSHAPKEAQLPHNPYQALKYAAIRWANAHGYQSPNEAYLYEIPFVEEWTALLHALNRLSFTPAENIGELFTSKEAQGEFEELGAKNPFRLNMKRDENLY